MALTGIVYVVFMALLIAAAAVDVRSLCIPNELVAALAVLWVIWRAGLAVGGHLVGTDFVTALIAPAPLRGVSLSNGIVGAVALGGGLLLVTAAYEALTKKRAMGGGDIKLLASVGLFLGLERGVVCLLVACIVSMLVSFFGPRVARAVHHEDDPSGLPPVMREVPFGPAIAVGSFVALLFP